jgi:hypothetical protein
MFDTPVHLLQPTFARGEVSPYLFGRVDLTTYASGLRTLRNGFVRPEGAVSNRQGTAYTGNCLSNTAMATKILPFIFSATQSYIIEVGAGSSQVFSGGALVTGGTASITNVAPTGIIGSSAVIITTATPHGLSVGENFVVSGVIGSGQYAINGSQTAAAIVSSTQVRINTGLPAGGAYTSGGTLLIPLNFATPWAAADLPLLRWSQSADTLTVVHPKYQPYEIKRTAANAFTCLPAVYNFGPFLPQNVDGVTFIYASAKTGLVTLTANAPIFNANQVGGLIQLTQQDLSPIQPWEPSKVFTNASGTGISPVGLYRRASLKNYLCVAILNSNTANPPYATGTVTPAHAQGIVADGDGSAVPNLAGSCGVQWEYQDSGFGVVLITGYTSPTQVQGIVQPNYLGGPGLLPLSTVGGPTVVEGPFTFSGTGSATTFSPLTGASSTDPTKFIVTIGGVYQGQSTYAISGTAITFLTPPPTGTNNIVVSQISNLGQTSYWAFGAFSADQGYPSTASYFPDRLVLAATPKQPVGVFGTQTSQYHNFQVSNPVVASDAFTIFLNARELNAISDLIPLSDLLVGTSNITWRLWPGSTGTALGPLAIAATPQSYYGQSPYCASVLFGDSAVYAEYDGRRLRDLIYQFAYDKFLGQELTQYSRHLIPYGTSMIRLSYKPDAAAQFIFAQRSDGQLLVCTYLREQQVIGWSHWDTLGTFEDHCVVPEGTAFGLYVIANRLMNGSQVRYIEKLSSREVTTIYDYKFLDCCSTYDGRNTSSTTMRVALGTSWLAGDGGVIVASSTAGWANFLPTDVGNEIWLYATLTFTYSVGSLLSGVLSAPVTPGQYVMNFVNGQTFLVTVNPDGVTCTWPQVLNSGPVLTATIRARCLITSYVAATEVNVTFKDPVPAQLQSVATAVWTFARVNLGGATQLAGASVAAFIDANVYGVSQTGLAPNGTITVGLDGSIVLPTAAGVAQIGIPYLFDFETLPLNEQGQETIRMRAKTEPVIYLDVTESRNFLAGTDFTNVSPQKQRAFEPYTAPTQLMQGMTFTRIASELTSDAHTCIRQNMPLPLTIRMHIPQVTIGEPIS